MEMGSYDSITNELFDGSCPPDFKEIRLSINLHRIYPITRVVRLQYHQIFPNQYMTLINFFHTKDETNFAHFRLRVQNSQARRYLSGKIQSVKIFMANYNYCMRVKIGRSVDRIKYS